MKETKLEQIQSILKYRKKPTTIRVGMDKELEFEYVGTRYILIFGAGDELKKIEIYPSIAHQGSEEPIFIEKVFQPREMQKSYWLFSRSAFQGDSVGAFSDLEKMLGYDLLEEKEKKRSASSSLHRSKSITKSDSMTGQTWEERDLRADEELKGKHGC